MKTVLLATAFLSAVAFISPSKFSTANHPAPITCFQDSTAKNRQSNMQQQQYRDIRTGRPLTLNYNQQSRMMMNTTTGQPVDFYINASTGDTISGYGYVVNNYLMMQPDSSYRLDMSRIRSTNNRYYSIKDNKELTMDKNWPGNRRENQGQRQDQNTRRDSLQRR